MKKLLIFCLLLLVGKISVAQYPVTQNIGADSTLTNNRGGLRSMGGIMNTYFADTTAANLTRVRQYSSAQIVTGTGQLWIRNSTATKWLQVATGAGVNLATSDLIQTDAVRTYSGNYTGSTNGSLTFKDFTDFTIRDFTRLIITPLTSGDKQDSIMVWNPSSKQVRVTSPGNFAGSCSPTIRRLNDSTLIVSQCPSGKIDTIVVHSGGVTVINNYYFTNDTTMQVCYAATPLCVSYHNVNPALPDSVVCTPQTTCETVVVTGVTSQYVFQNGLASTAQRVVEQGGQFNHLTHISGQNLYNFRYDSLNFTVRGVFGSGQPIDTIHGPGFTFSPRKGSIVAGYFANGGTYVNGMVDATLGLFQQNFGVNNEMTASYGYAHGISNNITGNVGTGWGIGNAVSGYNGTSWGDGNTLSGYEATNAGGALNTNVAHYAFSTGVSNQQYTFAGTVVGTYNDSLAKANQGNASFRFNRGRIFEIGNGTGTGAGRSNAVTVYNDQGRMIIGGATYDTASQLRLVSHTLGFGINSGTATQMFAIASPYNGLLYWCTDSTALCEYREGFGWRKVDQGGSGGGSGNTNSNIGSGFRLAVPNTNNVKTIFVTGGLTIDSVSNTNALTLGFTSGSVTDSTAFYRLRQLNDTTTVWDRRNGTSDTLVIGIRNNGGGGGGGGSITLAAFGTNPNANAATLSGSTLNLEPASATYPGGVSTTTQTFAGTKTFVQDIYVRNNIRLGRGAGDINTNLVFGSDALTNNTTGFQNFSSGYFSMNTNTTGSQNVALGYFTGFSNTSGSGNIFVGPNAGKFNTTGNYNIFMGVGAGGQSIDNGYSVIIGYGAGALNTSHFRSTAVGYAALANAQSSAFDEAAFGFNALTNLTTGQKNTALGTAAMENTTTGFQNSAFGHDVMLGNTSGYANTAGGWLGGASNQVGHDNVWFGWSAGRSLTTTYNMSYNVVIGSQAMYNASQKTDAVNTIVIGYNTYSTADNQVVIGNSDITQTKLRGTLYWNDDPGTAGYVLTSQGVGLPAVWTVGGGGGGGVSNFSFTDANGFDGTVTNSTTTPNLTLTTTVTNGQVIYSSSGAVVGSAGMSYNGTSDLSLGINGTAAGKVVFRGSTSGAVTVQAPATGTWSMTLPTTGGTNGYFLQTNGSGVTTWASVSGSGTVTSVATGYGLSGGTITTTGTLIADSSVLFPAVINTILLTTTGSSGAATWSPSTRRLNIPQYTSPTGAALTKTDDTNITLTLGGSPTTALLNAASLTLGWTGSLAPSRGGTGITSYTTGDLIYASATTTFSKIPIGAPNYVLTSSGGIPVWAAIGAGGPVTTPISSLLSAVAVNDIDNRGRIQLWRWDSLYNVGLELKATSTHANAQGTALLDVEVDGAHISADVLSAAAVFSNTHTGTNATNVAGYFTSSGGTYNLGVESIGNIGIYNTTPTALLELGSAFYSKTGSIGFNGESTGKVTMTVQTNAGTWTMQLPTDDGTIGQVLATDGTGLTYWATVSSGSGTVTNVSATDGSGFDFTVTNPTTTPNITLTTTVTATRVIYAGASGAVTGTGDFVYDGAGILSLGANSTSLGQLSLYGNTAGRLLIRPASNFSSWTLQLPAIAGASGQFLRTDGLGVTTWVSGNVGTVTSVDVSGGTTGMTYSGGPVTSSGTITMAGTLIAVNGGTGQSSYTIGDILYASSTTILSKRGIGTSGQVLTVSGGVPVWATPSSTTYTANSGLTMTANNTQLGGDLLNSPTISGSTTYNLSITGNYATGTHNGVLEVTQSSSTGRGIYSDASSGTAITGNTTSGSAISAIATSGYGVQSTVASGISGSFTASSSGIGVEIYTQTGLPLYISQNSTSTSTTNTLANLRAMSTNTVADGFGGLINFELETATTSTFRSSNQIISKWTTSADATRTSQFIITGVNSATTADLFTLSGSGALKMNKYGVGSFTGTAAYTLSVDASGNIIETSTGSAGTVTSIAAGAGMNFTTITTTGTVTMGTPSDITLSSTNSASGTTHTHAFVPGGTNLQYIDGTGALQTLPVILANNGLTKTSLTIQLGGALTQNTTISGSTSFSTAFTGSYATGTNLGVVMVTQSGTSGVAIYANNNGTGGYAVYGNASSSGTGVLGNATAGTGVLGNATSGAAIRGDATSGYGLYATATTGIGGFISVGPSSTNTVVPILQVFRTSSGTPASGIGGSIDFYTQTTTTNQISNTVVSKWTTATNASRVSNMVFTGVNNAVTADLLTLKGSGQQQDNKYGIGTFYDSSPAYLIGTDASGNFVEVDFSAPITTAGGVAFYNGTTLTQDNAQLHWDNSANYFGVGTDVPGFKLDVQQSAAEEYAASVYNDNTGGHGLLVGINSNTTNVIASFYGIVSATPTTRLAIYSNGSVTMSSGFSYNGTSTVTVGGGGTGADAVLRLYGNSSGSTLLTVPSSGSTNTLQFPGAAPADLDILQNASSGILQWSSVAALKFAYTAKTTTYTAGANDYVIEATSGSFTVNLPTAVGITGKIYIIKNAGSGTTTTVDAAGSETIDNAATKTLTVQYSGITIISNGVNWSVIGTF